MAGGSSRESRVHLSPITSLFPGCPDPGRAADRLESSRTGAARFRTESCIRGAPDGLSPGSPSLRLGFRRATCIWGRTIALSTGSSKGASASVPPQHPDKGDPVTPERARLLFPLPSAEPYFAEPGPPAPNEDPTQQARGWKPMSHLAKESFRVPYALRRVPSERMVSLLPVPEAPLPGDIALAQLESIGKNARLELASGRAATLHEGHLLAVVFGNRYASMQFEGYAGVHGDSCDLLSMGGVCGLVASKHEKVLEPSRLRLLGALGCADGAPLRLKDFALGHATIRTQPRILCVCGTDMDAGKTHTAMSAIKGLRRGGQRIAAMKLTGTAAGRDSWTMRDAGADPVLDFVDGGWPSTYLCEREELLTVFRLLLAHASALGAQWVVMEIADGPLQREPAALLGSTAFTEQVDAWLFAASSPLAAAAGTELLHRYGIEPLALTGLLTMSPLGMREASAVTGLQCFTAAELQRGILNERLSERAHRETAAS